ncbi:CbtB domain-containing protein [Ideonella sp. DXS29W]|uniref:CbtB domain-containing protein n=1 Tax=Ideonella lacteola TaxID=2984193 RepID=A0ABU9BLI0_9BURK
MNAHPTSLGSLAPARTGSLFTQIAAALLLGAVMVYGVEFSASPVAHNAAHDVRHANGRPCH